MARPGAVRGWTGQVRGHRPAPGHTARVCHGRAGTPLCFYCLPGGCWHLESSPCGHYSSPRMTLARSPLGHPAPEPGPLRPPLPPPRPACPSPASSGLPGQPGPWLAPALSLCPPQDPDPCGRPDAPGGNVPAAAQAPGPVSGPRALPSPASRPTLGDHKGPCRGEPVLPCSGRETGAGPGVRPGMSISPMYKLAKLARVEKHMSSTQHAAGARRVALLPRFTQEDSPAPHQVRAKVPVGPRGCPCVRPHCHHPPRSPTARRGPGTRSWKSRSGCRRRGAQTGPPLAGSEASGRCCPASAPPLGERVGAGVREDPALTFPLTPRMVTAGVVAGAGTPAHSVTPATSPRPAPAPEVFARVRQPDWTNAGSRPHPDPAGGGGVAGSSRVGGSGPAASSRPWAARPGPGPPARRPCPASPRPCLSPQGPVP